MKCRDNDFIDAAAREKKMGKTKEEVLLCGETQEVGAME